MYSVTLILVTKKKKQHSVALYIRHNIHHIYIKDDAKNKDTRNLQCKLTIYGSPVADWISKIIIEKGNLEQTTVYLILPKHADVLWKKRGQIAKDLKEVATE